MTALPEPPPAPVSAPLGPSLPPPRGSRAWTITLAVLLLAALAGLAFFLVQSIDAQRRLGELERRIDEQQRQIEDQDRTIREQQERVDEKEAFGAAMRALMGDAAALNGTVVGGVVPLADYAALAAEAWASRWDGDAMAAVIARAEEARASLDARRSAAEAEVAQNASGTAFETAIDELGGGFATSVLDDASATCGRPAYGCVSSDVPTVIHFDAAGNGQPYMTDWLRTGIAYHEFAHVLQFTHPEASEGVADSVFGGDYEVMADCFALTLLPGWTLDHTVWVSDFEYWEVSIGYGVACDAGQQQAIRDWYGALPLVVEPISQ